MGNFQTPWARGKNLPGSEVRNVRVVDINNAGYSHPKSRFSMVIVGIPLGWRRECPVCVPGDVLNRALCGRFLRPDLLIHLFQQILTNDFLKLPFVHKLSRDLLVLVYAIDK